MIFQHQRRPCGHRLSAATFGLVRHRQQIRVLIRQPGAGRSVKPVYLGLFSSAYEARQARDVWLLANVTGAADVYPWLRGRARDVVSVEVVSEPAMASGASRGVGVVA